MVFKRKSVVAIGDLVNQGRIHGYPSRVLVVKGSDKPVVLWNTGELLFVLPKLVEALKRAD